MDQDLRVNQDIDQFDLASSGDDTDWSDSYESSDSSGYDYDAANANGEVCI